MRTPVARSACESPIKKDLYKKNDYEIEHHHKDKKIDIFTVHQNEISDSSNPRLKNKIKVNYKEIRSFLQEDGRQRR